MASWGGGCKMVKRQSLPIERYDKMPQIQVGKYSISSDGSGKMWIEHESGEGGEFLEDLFVEYVEAFYNRFF